MFKRGLEISLIGHLATGANGFHADKGENEHRDERGELHGLRGNVGEAVRADGQDALI